MVDVVAEGRVVGPIETVHTGTINGRIYVLLNTKQGWSQSGGLVVALVSLRRTG